MKYDECVAVCQVCVAACEQCLARCQGCAHANDEKHAACCVKCEQCVGICRRCAEVCATTTPETAAMCATVCAECKAICEGCQAACAACGEGCEHCRAHCEKCGEECEECAEACSGESVEGKEGGIPIPSGEGESRFHREKAKVDEEPLRGHGVAIASGMETGAGREIVYMPGGRHTIHCSKGKRSVDVEVLVDEGSATALERQRAMVARERAPQKPYLDFNHEEGAAAFWPEKFFWRDPDGVGTSGAVWARGEWSAQGREAIEGKAYRALSPVFHVDDVDGKPARIVCNPKARLNFGGLVNDPAFRGISPLWAKDAGAKAPMVSGRAAASKDQNKRDDERIKMKEVTEVDKAELQAHIGKLERHIAELEAKEDAESRSELRATQAELKAARMEIRLAEQNERNVALEAAEKARKRQDADGAVKRMVSKGLIPIRDLELQGKWTEDFVGSPALIARMDGMQGSPALGDERKAPSGVSGALGYGAVRPGPALVMQAYGELCAKNTQVKALDVFGFQRKGELAREMAAMYRREIRGNEDVLDMPLMAATAADTLGTLAGTLVAQRTLELFKYQYPLFDRIYTDFGDIPAQFGQTVGTRKIVVPAVQTYSATLGADGRPAGWSTASAATTVDATITLDEHVGVPIVIDANTLASTVRRLFDEAAPAASYALAKYFVAKMYALCTPANFNSYVAVGAKVPIAYATYVVGLNDMSRTHLTMMAAAFNTNEVPLPDRSLLVNSLYHAKLATDPSLVTFYAPIRKPEMITENELPNMAKFVPIEAPDFPTTNSRVGMALQKNALIAMTRLSNDYTQALPGSSYGSVTTVTNPDIGISVVLVQYVNHTGGYAEWRIQVMIGGAVGDKRAGLVISSQ